MGFNLSGFAPTARYSHGEPIMCSYTTVAAVTAGDVVAVGNGYRIAHVDLAAAGSGDLAIQGGVYDIIKSTNTNNTFSAGSTVNFDVGNTCLTMSGTSMIGIIVKAPASGETVVRVLHMQRTTAAP